MKDQRFTNKKDLLTELVRTSFKLRYNNSFLGFIWVLLKPLLTFVVLYFVFSRFKGGWVENFQIYLLLGIILYTYVNDGIMYGMKGLLEMAHIILKVNFPREIALSSALILAFINVIINLLILIIFIAFNPVNPTVYALIYFFLILCVIFVLIYAISFFSSIILVKLRDLEHITTLVMQLLFYATPIFYPLDILPEKFQKIILLNPLTILIQASRSAVIYGEITYETEVFILFVLSLFLFVIGRIYFKRNVKRVAESF